MRLLHGVRAIGRDRAWWVVGAIVSLGVAIALYTRYSINNLLNRDEAIYAYGGQQLAHGVPPYVSVFDPKTPGATMIAGIAAAIAQAINRNDIYLIRLAFFACACLAVVAIYLLAARLWHSVLAGLVAAVVFASFQAFARDALAGPDAKTPGVLFTIVSMWLLARRQWLLGGFVATLAFLVWQPFVFYVLVAILVAGLSGKGRQRWLALARAVAGVAIPLIGVVVYFAVAGGLSEFIESAVVFPVTGVAHSWSEILTRIHTIAHVVRFYYAFSGALFAAGLLAIGALAIVHVVRGRHRLSATLLDPFICVVVLTMLTEVLYATYDFQSYPDLYPLLPYPALGLAGVAAVSARRLRRPALVRLASGGVVVALAVLVGFSWNWFSTSRANNHLYFAQRDDACAVEQVLVPGTTLYSLGDPAPLVFTHRRNPDRYIYLGEDVDQWKVDHTPGGFLGWAEQIQASNPSVVLVGGEWNDPLRYEMGSWLRSSGYTTGWLGDWYAFLTGPARARAAVQGVQITPEPTVFAMHLDGTPFSCTKP